MAISGEKRWPRMGRNKWPLTAEHEGEPFADRSCLLGQILREPKRDRSGFKQTSFVMQTFQPPRQLRTRPRRSDALTSSGQRILSGRIGIRVSLYAAIARTCASENAD
jgi:hypothetical protein